MFSPDFTVEPSLKQRNYLNLGIINPNFEISRDIKNIRMTLNEVTINKKKEIGKAEVYIIAVVIDNKSEQPIKIIISDIYKNIKRGDKIPFGPNGFVIYRNEKDGVLPNIIDYKILVVESDEGVRDFGKIITEISNDKKFKEFATSMLAISGMGSPLIPLVAAASIYTLELMGKFMTLNKDDQLLLVQGSFDDKFDDCGTIYNEIVLNSSYASIKYQVKGV